MMNPRRERSGWRLVALGQAAYFVVTGIWPLVHIRSFEWITGPKVDRWLVKTVGVLVAVIGAAIGLAARRQRISPEIEVLAIGSSLGLAAIDVVYVTRRRVRPVYLLDAVGQVVLIAGWVASRRGERPARSSSPTVGH